MLLAGSVNFWPHPLGMFSTDWPTMMAVGGICKLCLHFCFQIQELKPTFEVLCVQLYTDVITVLMDNVCVYLFVCHLTDLCNNWCIYVNIHFLVFWCYVCNNYYTVALPEANNVTMHGEDSALGGTNSIKYPCMHKCSSELFPTKWWCLYGYVALSGNQGISLYFPINVHVEINVACI